MKTAPAIRTVSGTFGSSANVSNGTGFTVTKVGTGQFLVRFVPAFRSLLNVNTMTTSGNTGSVLTALSADSFSVTAFATSTNALTDVGVSFTASGVPQ
jgi:hypothetical protein